MAAQKPLVLVAGALREIPAGDTIDRSVIDALHAVTVDAPLQATGSTNVNISIPKATAAADGYLGKGDFAAFAGKAPIDSPTFTGTPTAPTAPTGTATDQLSTTMFVKNATDGKVDKTILAGNTDLNSITETGFYRVEYLNPNIVHPFSQVIVSRGYDTVAQMSIYYASGTMAVRGANIVSGVQNWTPWRTLLADHNFNSYAPTLTGVGASGSWNINASGTAVADNGRDAGIIYPNGFAYSARYEFVTGASAGNPGSSYSGVMTFTPYDGQTVSGGGNSYQLAFGSNANYGTTPDLKIRNGVDTTWNNWYTLWHSGNLTPSSGGEANTVVKLDSNANALIGNYLVAKNLTSNTQALSFDDIKPVGLYHYDYGVSGTQPPIGSANWRTIEIGADGRYSQIAMPFDADKMYFRRQLVGVWSPWNEVFHTGNLGKYVEAGNFASGSVNINASVADHQKITASGNFTLTLSGFRPSGTTDELLLECVNFGGKTIAFPAINWVKSDGSFTTAFASNGVTLQASGTDFILIWTHDGDYFIWESDAMRHFRKFMGSMLYAWNPLDKTADTILTGNNLSIQNNKAAYIGARGITPKTSGKWYWEVTLDAYPGAYGSNFSIGVATSDFGLNGLAGNSGNSAGLFIINASEYCYGDSVSVSVVSGGGVPASGHTFSVLFDADNNLLKVLVNGFDYTGFINMTTGYGVALYPVITFYSPTSTPMTFTANFGASAFKYPVPSGYKAIL